MEENSRFSGSNPLTQTKTDMQCLHRYQKVLFPERKNEAWSIEEDNTIREEVFTNGATNWSNIAKMLPGRIGKQCRERWFNTLDPTLRTTDWSEVEKRLVYLLHKIHKNRWSVIAKEMKGRCDNNVKNLVNSKLKRNMKALNYWENQEVKSLTQQHNISLEQARLRKISELKVENEQTPPSVRSLTPEPQNREYCTPINFNRQPRQSEPTSQISSDYVNFNLLYKPSSLKKVRIEPDSAEKQVNCFENGMINFESMRKNSACRLDTSPIIQATMPFLDSQLDPSRKKYLFKQSKQYIRQM